jgi:hypothetical protein
MFDSIFKSKVREGESAEQAAKFAQQAVQRNMQPASSLDLPELWNRGGLYRMLLLFSSETIVSANMVFYDIPRQILNGNKATALRAALAISIASMMLRLLAVGGPDGDDDEAWSEWFMKTMADASAGNIPVIGQEIMQVVDGGVSSPEKTIATTPFWNAYTGVRNILESDDKKVGRNGLTKGETGTLALLNAYSLLKPFPYAQTRKLYMAGKAQNAADALLVFLGNRQALARTRKAAREQGNGRRRGSFSRVL